ncbi:hypothetical protein [Bacillus sp. SA1-12]|uniref:hypothetical protein n=1 Tax=Bacillus sp. SA1-12 TaxID=1455638 RepID=UPI0012DFEAA8|nr:hypothetical protein [Bacillus sp. SA1-12]
MKKFLIGFGGFLILLGAGGIINHISMTFKAVQEEQEMYGGSVQFMMLQLMGSLEPYLTSLIGGGVIISIAMFLNEYQKRSELTSQLIQVLSEQNPSQKEDKVKETSSKQENLNDAKTVSIPQKTIELDNNQDDERFYWNG